MTEKSFLKTSKEVRVKRNINNFFKTAPKSNAEQNYYEEIESYVTENKKFGIKGHVTKFYFKNTYTESAEESFKKTINKLIEIACNKKEKENKISKISLNLYCKGITDPVIIPIRPMEQLTVDVIFNEFIKLQQSHAEINLLDQEISTIITTYSTPIGNGRKSNKLLEKNDLSRIRILNDDNFCLFYALELTRHYQLINNGITYKKYLYLSNNPQKQKNMAMILLKDACISENEKAYGVEHLKILQSFWDKKYQDMFRIVAFEMTSGIRPIFKGLRAKKFEVGILLDRGHWYGLKSIRRFFNVRNFCVSCESVYHHPEDHAITCVERCKRCCRVGFRFPCPSESIEIYCKICNMNFYNNDCFKAHTKKACKQYHKCKGKCGEIYNTKTRHICEKFCKNCKTYHIGRQCYIRPLRIKPKLPNYKIIAYDIEATFWNNDLITKHVPNLISAAFTCSKCCGVNKNCEVCKTNERMLTWSVADGINPLEKFIDWILEFKFSNTVAFGHYAGRYDSHFVLNELTRRGYKPKIMITDLKIYQIKLNKLVFRDFWLLSQNRLSVLPKTLGLNTPAKLFFPHKYNKPENFGCKLNHLPCIDDYGPNNMKEDEYDHFMKWYEQNRDTKFELGEQLKKYCENDVQILLEAILKFRELFLNITHDVRTPYGYDVIKDGITIAGIVMKIFRGKFLLEKHIPILPEKGFETADNQSVIAIKYFNWISFRDNVKVRHACNGGEVSFGGLKVDCIIGAQKKIIEFHGCAFHGHPKCYKPQTVAPNGKTMHENYCNTVKRIEKLQNICKNFRVEEIWECEVREELKNDKEMKNFFANIPDKGQINPRDAYAGGRTMPFALYEEATESSIISMFDIISLYPFVNYSTPYPVGIPKVIKKLNPNVTWTNPDDIPYDGLLKVKVIPPKKMRYPLLPFHADGFLLFPTCMECARKSKPDFVRFENFKKCQHSANRRGLIGVFTSIELRKALELGYKITKFYRAYHYEKFDTNLFKNYVRMFLKIKIESSGWPENISIEKQKKEFIDMYQDKYAIELNPKNVKKNPGLRLIAKLGLNSLWGKFSMRNSLCQTKIIDSTAEWYNLLLDDSIELASPIIINDDMIRVIYRKKQDFIKEHGVSNIILSLWTTSAARIVLYEYMEKIFNTPACRLLYCDTDSLIFSHPRDSCPLKEGMFLGEMTREYTDSEIVEYVSGGPKQYALKLKRRETGEIWYKTKIRGITLDRNNKFDYQTFKNMVLKYREGESYKFEYPDSFGPSRENLIISREVKKEYKPIQKKGIIDADLSILPFGYF